MTEQYSFNVTPGTLVLSLGPTVENVPYATYDTFAPIVLTSVPQHTSRFWLTMAAGGISPYHLLRTDYAPSKGIVVTPTSGGIIYAVGLVVTKPKPPLLR